AGVYRWAIGRSWADQFEANPTQAAARAGAVEALDGCIERLQAIEKSLAASEERVMQNLRFRLARAIVDRADFEEAESFPRKRLLAKPLPLLGRPFPEASLRGFAALLEADTYAGLGRADDALRSLDAAARANPPVPADEMLHSRVGVLIALKRF